MSDVGTHLRRLRVRAELTQAELGALADVEPKTISEIETGKRRSPSPLVIGKLDIALESDGQLLERLERSRDDQSGWQSVLAHLDQLQQRLGQIEAGQSAIVDRLGPDVSMAAGIRGWVITLAGYGESMTERERQVITSLARQLADKHALPPAT